MSEPWQTIAFRQTIAGKLEKAFAAAGDLNKQSAVKMEIQLFSRAKGKHEYLQLVANCIRNLTQNGQATLKLIHDLYNRQRAPSGLTGKSPNSVQMPAVSPPQQQQQQPVGRLQQQLQNQQMQLRIMQPQKQIKQTPMHMQIPQPQIKQKENLLHTLEPSSKLPVLGQSSSSPLLQAAQPQSQNVVATAQPQKRVHPDAQSAQNPSKRKCDEMQMVDFFFEAGPHLNEGVNMLGEYGIMMPTKPCYSTLGPTMIDCSDVDAFLDSLLRENGQHGQGLKANLGQDISITPLMDSSPPSGGDNVVAVMLHLEIISLTTRFRIELSHGQPSGRVGGALQLVCHLDHHDLPAVPQLTVRVPKNYPDQSPVVALDPFDHLETPFLFKVAKRFNLQLEKMPKAFTLSQLLTSWEMCVRATLVPDHFRDLPFDTVWAM